MSQNPTTVAGRKNILEFLPSNDEILQSPTLIQIRREAGEVRSLSIVREAAAKIRSDLLEDDAGVTDRTTTLKRITQLAENVWILERGKRTQRVINATGVVIHTNLGRAPLSAVAVDAIVSEASGYATVEYNVETGSRGKRGERSETLLCQLTGAEAAIVVNNCAAAALMVLTVFAKTREVLISRGELVEIGGDFRVPDVLIQSGATLREVGTTNRTKLADYENAVGENTAMILRVHPSNYRITGFTAKPALSELGKLAREKGLMLYEDAGSGALSDLSAYGLDDEPVISRSIGAGADIVSFSGDKLLGGPQAGLIVGKRSLIDTLRKSPLYRALRVSKLVYAALEATLESHARGAAENEIPVMAMLASAPENLKSRSEAFAERLNVALAGTKQLVSIEVTEGESVVGGGAAPGVRPPTSLVALQPKNVSAASFERKIRMSSPPVIARLQNDRVLIDLRTVRENEESELLNSLTAAASA